MTSTTYRLRASWALPILSEPIPDAELIVEGDRIVEVRPRTSGPAPDALDFGDAILMPGLVNVHTHLEYTVMRGLLEDIEFFPWIRELTERKAALNADDWIASATWGAAEAASGGVTTIGDCADQGAAADGAKALGLRGVIYQEVFGIDERSSVEEIVADLSVKVERLRERLRRSQLRVGVSPHAPYTVRPALFEALARYVREENLPVCIHAAESQAEAELLRSGTGPIAEMFARRGIQWTPPGRSTVAYLDTFGILGPRTLLVHGVQLAASDRKLIAERDVAWAHCPKSNAKLGVGVSPLGLITHRARAGHDSPMPPVRLGLGSDSVASNNTMDLFEEMRFAVLVQRAARRRIGVSSARQAVEMATIGGAAALGLESEIGALAPGRLADLCVVKLGGLRSAPASDPYSALVYAANASDVRWTMANGAVIHDAAAERPLPAIDLTIIGERLNAAANKMRDWRPSAR